MNPPILAVRPLDEDVEENLVAFFKTTHYTTVRSLLTASRVVADQAGWRSWRIELVPTDACPEAVELGSVMGAVEDVCQWAAMRREQAGDTDEEDD